MKVFENLKKFKWQIVFVIALTFMNALGELYLPKLMSIMIDKGVANVDFQVISKTGTIMIIVVIVTVFFRSSAAYFSAKTAMGYSADLRHELYSKINRMSTDDTEVFGTSSLITRTTEDVTQVEQLILLSLRPMVRAPLMFVGGLIMALNTNVKLSGVFLIAIPVMSLLLLYVVKKAMPFFQTLQEKLDNLNMYFRRRLSGIFVIRAFSTDPYEEELFKQANDEYYKTGVKVNIFMSGAMPVLQLIMNIAIALIFYFGARLINVGELKIGELMAYVQYISQVLFSMIMVSIMASFLPRFLTSANRVEEVLQYETHKTGGNVELNSHINSIKVKDLTYVYPGANRPVIENLNFEINAGETLGIIGGTGSGKTTFLKLLLQFASPTSGDILINGISIDDVETKSLRSRLSYVPQQNYFFTKPVGDNLKYADINATEEVMINALSKSHALEFLESEPLKEEMIRGGKNFSGGQRQRLAIARALTRDADVYLFDDSFSALDYITDSKIRSSLNKNLDESISIIVAQRIATIRNADKILLLEDGEQKGFGTHEDLMHTSKIYREIAISQGEDEK